MGYDYMWKVVPLCERQLRDVNPDDVLNGGLYRKCNVYKGGGGYDKFPEIYERRFGHSDVALNDQFVVQLYGCPCRCPYCYVTKDGVFGTPVYTSTTDLVKAFADSGCGVFHLMGGAPALYYEYWKELVSTLRSVCPAAVFHSDLLLIEKLYDPAILKALSSYDRSLYAVSIKGSGAAQFKTNTGIDFDSDMFIENMRQLTDSGLNFYLTYTGMSDDDVKLFKLYLYSRLGSRYEKIVKDSFSIDLIQYEALK